MRSEATCMSSSYFNRSNSDGTASPPATDVWSTERRLREKLPPGAPARRRRPSSSSKSSVAATAATSAAPSTSLASMLSHQFRSDCLLLPSRTIDEDDDDTECKSPQVSLSFRPTRLFFDSEQVYDFSHTKDPTTVLLVPEETMSWNSGSSDPYGDVYDDDDTALSPRLFRFGGQTSLSRYIILDVIEADESEFIFRQRHGRVEDDREGMNTMDDEYNDLRRQFSQAAPTMGRCPDEDRV